MISTSAYTLSYKGCILHYWLHGDSDRPVVVFTHAAGIDHREWEATLPILAERYRVLTWDVRGHGLSRPNSLPFTIAQATEDLLAILDHLNIEQAILVGHSLGGNITQEVIFRFSHRIRAAILLGCANNTGKLSSLERFEIQASGPLFALYPYNLLRRQSADMSAERPEVRAYLYEAFGQMTKAEFVTVLLALLRCLHSEPDYHIPVPFLLAHGEHDRTGNIRQASPVWAKHEPLCEYAVIPRAGHVANMDNPDAFHSVLLSFLAKHVDSQ
jgi:3-oxoadipate enol-lactonase